MKTASAYVRYRSISWFFFCWFCLNPLTIWIGNKIEIKIDSMGCIELLLLYYYYYRIGFLLILSSLLPRILGFGSQSSTRRFYWRSNTFLELSFNLPNDGCENSRQRDKIYSVESNYSKYDLVIIDDIKTYST